MDKYVPDMYRKSIFDVNYDLLSSRGIKCLLFDLDNTLALISEKKPRKEVIELFNRLKEKGFKIIIFTNSPSKRVKPFKNILEVDCCPFACKPFSRKFLSIIKIYNLQFSEIAIIGDSMMDDIYGGNKVGITTILIERLGNKEFFIAALKRKREKRIIKKLTENNLFVKGKYYE
jgi:HAD superfamily phosphatase (TIGR01668 family)